MPGLSFLTKKSWHTRTIQNIEKKWIAEQKHAEEQKKILELQKQRQEEREMMNMRNHARKGEKIVSALPDEGWSASTLSKRFEPVASSSNLTTFAA